MNVKRNMRMSPQKTARVTSAVLPAENMTLLTFLGRGSNTRPYYGAAPFYQRYEFGGKHKTRNVLDSDVPVLLAMLENGRALFEKTKIVAPAAKVAPVDLEKTIYPSDMITGTSPETPLVKPLVETVSISTPEPTPMKKIRKPTPTVDPVTVGKPKKKAVKKPNA